MTLPDSTSLRSPSSAADDSTPWRPIASGRLAHSLATAVAAVAEDLAEPRAAWLPAAAPPPEQDRADLSLAGGAAGQAVLHAYLAAEGLGRDSSARATRALSHAIEGVSRVDLDASLFSGFTGIAWAMEHLRDRAADDGASLEAVDDELVSYLARRGPDHFDLVSGLAGIAVYALERRPRAKADELLRLVIARLAERAERMPIGISWRTPPEVFASPGFALGPFDLGLAHGVPGVIAVLAAACEAEVEVQRARSLLSSAIEWLETQRLPKGAGSAYSNSAGPGATGAASRVAWCYGDLGIACALHLAGRISSEPAWRDQAIALALNAGARDPEAARVCDAPFCHGAAGVAHLLNRLYQSSAEERLADLARSWLDRALMWREPGSGFGGFRSWAPRESVTGDWVNDPGLLSGAAGIGLVFCAAQSNVEPEWDRLLLLSTRRRDV